MQRTEFDAHAYATAVARYGLARAEPPSVVSDEDWSLALATLAEEKVLGIATAAATDGWLPLADEQYADLVNRQRNAMAWCLGLEHRLLQIADAFDSEGIDFIVLKGPAVAHTVYPDPSWRTFNDLDVLVRTVQWRAACAVLEEGFGWPRRLPEPRRGFDEHFGKAAVFTTDTGQQVDLHRTLAQGPFGIWIEPEALFDRTSPANIAGRTVRRLDSTAAFLHACVHTVLGDGRSRLIEHRDLVQIQAGGLDGEWLEEVARRWRVGPLIARAVAAAEKTFGPGVGDVAAIGSPRAEGWALRAYEMRRGGRLAMHLAMLRAIPGAQRKATYVRALAVPRGEFIRARGAKRWRRPLAWVVPVSMRGRAG